MARQSREERGAARLDKPTIDWAGNVPTQFEFPELADLVSMDDAALSEILRRFGVTPSSLEMRASAAAYVSRMTGYAPNSDAWNKAVDALLDNESQRGLLSMCRSAMREFSILEAANGDLTTEFCRISEGDDHVCPQCQNLAGEEGTLAYHATIGMPGAASCDGGDMCRCQLVAVI